MLLAVEPVALRALTPALLGAAFDAAHPVAVAQQRALAEDEVYRQVFLLTLADLAHTELLALVGGAMFGAEGEPAILARAYAGQAAMRKEVTVAAGFGHPP